MSVTLLLLFGALVILSCVLLNNFSNRTGIPMLLAFLALGMVVGTDGLLKIEFDDYSITKDICSIALIFIMFYGGFGTRWKEARPVFIKAGILATAGVFMTAALTGLFCRFVLKMDLMFSFLTGAVLSSTDTASVFSILRSKKLGLKNNTASLLEIESGSNDPCSYMLTILMISVIGGEASGGKILYMLFAQLVYGSLLGIGIALSAVWLMKKFRNSSEGFDALFVLATAILAYAVPDLAGGNGYISTYLVGIILGNANIKGKKTLVPFFDGFTSLMQVIIFFLLGLLATPSQLPQVALPAILIAVFITLIGRPLSVFSILTPFRCSLRQQTLVSFVGLRGAASIVFAIMATPAAIQLTGNGHDLFNIVFTIVLLSIGIQGSLIPAVSRKLKMIDNEEDIMKTFTDYQEETDVQFIQLNISEKDPWNGRIIRELDIPYDTILAVVIRDGIPMIPNGKMKLLAGDKIVMSAKDFEDHKIIHLSERKIDRDSGWVGKKVFQYSPDSNELIVMIKRGEQVIIPRGNTIICAGDIMVINKITEQV